MKAISKSTVRTVTALANSNQGQSYMFESSTTLFVPCACLTFVFKLFKQASHYPEDYSGISLNFQAIYL